MSKEEELRKQQELERKNQEKARQEQEKQIRREEELRKIRERQINEKKANDDLIKGKPTGGRPEKDD